MLLRRLPCLPRASSVLLAGCPECNGTIPIYHSHVSTWFDDRRPCSRPACTPRDPSTTSREATIDAHSSKFRETVPHFRTVSRYYMYQAWCIQKEASEIRESGRCGLGFHKDGVSMVTDHIRITLRAQKRSPSQSHGHMTDHRGRMAQPEQRGHPSRQPHE